MVDGVVYRNSSTTYQGPYAVPWRPVTMRPLLRTNTGVAPMITGTYAGPSVPGLAAGTVVSVPAGSVVVQGVIAYNNTLSSVTVTNPPVRLDTSTRRFASCVLMGAIS